MHILNLSTYCLLLSLCLSIINLSDATANSKKKIVLDKSITIENMLSEEVLTINKLEVKKPKPILSPTKKPILSPTKKPILSNQSKKWKSLYITSILIGKDRPMKEAYRKDSLLPIVITVLSKKKGHHEAYLRVYIKNIQTGQTYPINNLPRFQLTYQFAQHQINWDGKDLNNKIVPAGKYALICTLQTKSSIPEFITRAWGKGLKNYFFKVNN